MGMIESADVVMFPAVESGRLWLARSRAAAKGADGQTGPGVRARKIIRVVKVEFTQQEKTEMAEIQQATQ